MTRTSFRSDPNPPASEARETPAAIEPALHRVPHRGRVIFGMRPGQHDRVIGEKLVAVLVQVLVGDHVIVDALAVEPVKQMRVGIVLVERRPGTAEP